MRALLLLLGLVLAGCNQTVTFQPAPCTYDPSDPFQSSVDDQRGLCVPLERKSS